MTTAALEKQAQSLGLTGEEFKHFFERLGRTPTLEEVAVIGAMWSEHCSYKSSKVHLKRFHTSEPWVLQGPGENAGVIALNDEWALAFKMESHNHPSFIEPYQGAATGVGGILRDVFCMGARPIAAANALRFGIEDGSGLMTKLVRGVVRGIGDYGNSFGVPTVTGQTAFDERYSKNILVNAFAAGVVHRKKIFRAKVSEKNVLIYYGQPTGRDGVHGATMSSDEFSDGAETLKPTVQVGCPFSEKKLLEATLGLLEKNLVVGMQDMGAAGLTSSGAEMAAHSQLGACLDLETVPMRAANLKPYELLLSESQERMLCAVEPHNVDAVLAFLKNAGVAYAIVGTVTNTQRFQCRWHGKLVVDLPNELIENAPPRQHVLQDRLSYLEEHQTLSLQKQPPFDSAAHQAICEGLPFGEWLKQYRDSFLKLTMHQNFCSREALTQHYDGSVQGHTIAGCQSFFSGNAALVRLPAETQPHVKNAAEPGVAIAVGCKEHWIELNPHLGAEHAVVHLARKIRALGATPLAMTDCLNFGSLTKPAIARQFSDTVDGLSTAAKALRIPVVSGNVSLNNQTNGQPILPTPMLGMVGLHNDVRAFFKSSLPANCNETPATRPTKNLSVAPVTLYVLTCQKAAFYKASPVALTLGGSIEAAALPPVDYQLEQRSYEVLAQMFELRPLMVSCTGKGGLAFTLMQMAKESHADFSWSDAFLKKPAAELFSEGQNQWIFAFTDAHALKNFSSLVAKEGFVFEEAGILQQSSTSQINSTLQTSTLPIHSTLQTHIGTPTINNYFTVKGA